MEGTTPDSLLALHAAGYREVRERLGAGRVLDAGCGFGFESARMQGDSREVLGVDYDLSTALEAHSKWSPRGLRIGCMDAARLGLRDGSVQWVCSSHLVEHFWEPIRHVAEVARVLSSEGTAFFLTPNRPADFENPFHLVLFEREDLAELLHRCFEEVTVEGLDGNAHVKEDFARRRERANRLLSVDFLKLRHRIPRNWYIAAYSRALPLAYRLMAQSDTGGSSGITDSDFSVTGGVDSTTLVLFATARRPRRRAGQDSRSPGPPGG